MPRKQSRNAFWFFMSEWKTLQEQKGRTFPNGYRDVQADPECNEAWRALTPAQKEPYTTKAKRSKSDQSMDKKTGTGESVTLIKQEEQEALDAELNMDAHVRLTIANAKKYRALASLSFPFIHMNYYYMREPDNAPVDFCPAEFALGEFSIENGVSRYCHEIIKTTIQIGYTREAMETSEKTHRLNWDLPCGEADWAIMYHKIMIFLEPMMVNGNLPPIYTSKKFIHMLPSFFRRITAAVGQPASKFSVYPLEVLYGHMLRAVTDHPESNVVAILAESQLSKELFAYTPDIECDYHKTLEGAGQFCSLSIIRQWGFEFCDQCCRPLGVEMIPGVHCPESTGMLSSNNTFNGAVQSFTADRPTGVLSATGVSLQHRISVSERDQTEEARRRREYRPLEIIDHSLKTEEERRAEAEPESLAHSVPVAVPIPSRPLRAPVSASQALKGTSRTVPIFNGENFPAIGGRGTPFRTQNGRIVGPVWCHRGRKNSDSD